MKSSCNGCRVLRKGCGKSCSIRPCLEWIESPESQANATVFLAKFYGRTGLVNLINSGPDDLRPAIFKSLLYEACGRIVNPTYGSVGLLWSGSWPVVEAAVEAVLKGEPIVPISSDDDAAAAPIPNPTCNIRHVMKTGLDSELHRVSKIMRTKFKRTAKASNVCTAKASKHIAHMEAEPANEPELSHSSSNEGPIELICCRAQQEVSADTIDAASHVSQGEPEDVGLNLTLGFGFEPTSRDCRQVESEQPRICELSSIGGTDARSVSLELQLRV